MVRLVVGTLLPLAFCLEPIANIATCPKTVRPGVRSPDEEDHVSLLQTRASRLNAKEAAALASSGRANRDEEGVEESHSPVGFAEANDVFAASYTRTPARRGGMGSSDARLLDERRRSITEAGGGQPREVDALRRTERHVEQLRHDQEVDEFRASEEGAKEFDEALQELHAQNEVERKEEAKTQLAEAARAASDFHNEGVVPSVADVLDEEAEMKKDEKRMPAEEAGSPGRLGEKDLDSSEGTSQELAETVEEEQAEKDGTDVPEDPIPDRLQSRLKQVLQSRVDIARGIKVTQPEESVHREVDHAELQNRDRQDSEEQPAVASYVRDAGRSCGNCSDENDLAIGAGKVNFDAATRETAADVCGKVCNKHNQCVGFVFSNVTQRCYYKANTACQASRDLDQDCFTKADLWVPPADALVPDVDETPRGGDFDKKSGDDSVTAKKRKARARTEDSEHGDTATKKGAVMVKKHKLDRKRRQKTGSEAVRSEDDDSLSDDSSFDDIVLGSKILVSSGALPRQSKVKTSGSSNAKNKSQKGSNEKKTAKKRKHSKKKGGKTEHKEDVDKEERLDIKEQMRLEVKKAMSTKTARAHSNKETSKAKRQSKHEKKGKHDKQEEGTIHSFDDVVLGSELLSSSDDSSSWSDSSANHESKDLKSAKSIQKAIDEVKQQIKELKQEKHSANKSDVTTSSTSMTSLKKSKRELKKTAKSSKHMASPTSKKEHHSKHGEKESASELKASKKKSDKMNKSKVSKATKDLKDSKHAKDSKELRQRKESKETKDTKASKNSGVSHGRRHSSKASKSEHKPVSHRTTSAKTGKGSKHQKGGHEQPELDAGVLSEILQDEQSDGEGDRATLDSAMAPWAEGEKDTNICPKGYEFILTQEEAREAASFFDAKTFPDFLNSARNDRPNGCFKWVNGAFYFNPREMPVMDPHGTPVCKRQVHAPVSLTGAAHTKSTRSHGALKVAGDFYIVNAEHKKYLMPTDDGVSLWAGTNGTLNDLGSVPGDLLWRFASRPNSASFLLGNLGRNVYLTAFGGHVNTHTPQGASQLDVKNNSVLSWAMELVPNATDRYYLRFGSDGQFLDSEGSSLAALDAGGVTSGGPPRSSEWQLVRVTEGSVCNDYMASSGCDWTEKWSCPGQDGGTFGNASSHGGRGSQGYNCCCELQMHAQALPDVPQHVLPQLSHADAEVQPTLMTEQVEEGSRAVANETESSSRAELISDLKTRIAQLEKSVAEGEFKAHDLVEGNKTKGNIYDRVTDTEVEHKIDKEAAGEKVSDKIDKEAGDKIADDAWQKAFVKQGEVGNNATNASKKAVLSKVAGKREEKPARMEAEDWEADYKAIVAKGIKTNKRLAEKVDAEVANKKKAHKDSKKEDKMVDEKAADEGDHESAKMESIEKVVVAKVANESVASNSNLHSNASLETFGSKTGALPPIGFIKTHHTGASSLARALRQFGTARNLSVFQAPGSSDNASGHGLGWPLEFPGTEAIKLNGARPQQFDMICDNAVFNKEKFGEYLKPSPFFFSVLRTPASQIRSSFAAYHTLVDADWDSRLSWLAQLWRPKAPDLGEHPQVVRASFQNPQAHDLGWYEHVSGSFMFDNDTKVIGSWVKKLEQSMGLVLLREHMDEGLLLLRRSLGLEIADIAQLRVIGDAAGKREAAPTDAQSKEVEKFLRVDSELYSHFNATFWQKWAEAGDEESLRQELEELRHQAAALHGANDAIDSAGDDED